MDRQELIENILDHYERPRNRGKISGATVTMKGGNPGCGDVITYCRIGERSAHTWFVLAYLLGYPSVRNYDGSWTEYGNLVGVPIER